jgi:hypothetical protein
VNATATSKDSGQTTLKDLQPVGVTDDKHKTQQYDLLFVAPSGKDSPAARGEKQITSNGFRRRRDLTYMVNGKQSDTEAFERQTGRLHHSACGKCHSGNAMTQSLNTAGEMCVESRHFAAIRARLFQTILLSPLR